MLRYPLRCEDAARSSPLRYASRMLRYPLRFEDAALSAKSAARVLRDPLRYEDAARSAVKEAISYQRSVLS